MGGLIGPIVLPPLALLLLTRFEDRRPKPEKNEGLTLLRALGGDLDPENREG